MTGSKKKQIAAATSADSSSPECLYYVGIGASAGGLEALRPFVANLPSQANMVYIVAQHMSPDHRSLMVELLARETGLKVEEAQSGLTPVANTIYVAPPNTDINIAKGSLHLSKPTNTIGPKPSVDRFFMSLANDLEERAVGIILSGTGSDGAHGIKAIKAAGGITIAQDPATAKYDSMPNAAIRIGGADLVLPPVDMAAQLSSIISRPLTAITDDTETQPVSVRTIVQLILTTTGMNFTNYKDATLSRQIMRRMTAKQMPNLESYHEYIKNNHEELLELASNFLICVTSFFRDPEAFSSLETIIKSLLEKKQKGDEIRIWVPGCATGEEVYTIAILLAETLQQRLEQFRIKIFATDINKDAIQIARSGIYPEASLAGVRDDLIGKYFDIHDGMYFIHKTLKDMVLFAKQDLVQDPPFVRVDLISCRNLLIYFKPELQEEVLKIFHYALLEHGSLFLGKSETIGKQTNLFTEKDRKNKIYSKRPAQTQPFTSFKPLKPIFDRNDLPLISPKPAPVNLQAQERLSELYSPPSMLVTQEGEILEFFADCSPFIAVKTGKADFNLFSMIKPPFRAEARAFLHRVQRGKESIYGRPTAVMIEGQETFYRLAAHNVSRIDSQEPDIALISFERCQNPDKTDLPDQLDGQAAARIQDLEQEVVLTRENLQTVIEELETANEELQSLNEEAQAANEELQASNEELETANEELQASNEELITVNDELNSRTQELATANEDLTNILHALYKGLVVVDMNLQITRYNKIALQFFNIPAGEKINIATVPLHCEIPSLLNRLQKVLQQGVTDEHTFKKGDGSFYLMRMSPYRHRDQTVGGAVLTVIDITDQKHQEEKLRLSASVFEHATEATIITDANNTILAVNPAFSHITGYTAEEVVGKNPKLLSSGTQDKLFYQHMWFSIQSTGSWQGEILNRRKNGELYHEWLSINVLKDEDGKIIRHIGVFSDITDAKKAQEIIEHQANFDSLTGLPNRNLTLDRLNQLIRTAKRDQHQFAVLFLDIDNFKSVNDSLGHSAGDELIEKVAGRLISAVRDVDTVGRMGGDEFVILLNEIKQADDADRVANKIIREMSQPILINGHTLRACASIGIALYPMDGSTDEVLLKHADNAMYEAKKGGRNQARFYTQEMQTEANKRHWLAQELSKALQQNQLQAHYQPVIDIQSNRICGAEALARWRHPEKGNIPPDVFIPIAEQNSLITDLSNEITQQCLQDSSAWKQELSVALNLSVAQFISNNHMQHLLHTLQHNPLAQQRRITLEITESIKLADNQDYLSLLYKLKDCGCKIAIDDFGTGYSSLSYLKRIPIDIVKIDKSFVRDILTDETDAAMIRAILQMADAFKLATVAEGVETEEQLEFLKQAGCQFAQGYLFSPPLANEAFVDFTRNWQSCRPSTA